MLRTHSGRFGAFTEHVLLRLLAAAHACAPSREVAASAEEARACPRRLPRSPNFDPARDSHTVFGEAASPPRPSLSGARAPPLHLGPAPLHRRAGAHRTLQRALRVCV